MTHADALLDFFWQRLIDICPGTLTGLCPLLQVIQDQV